MSTEPRVIVCLPECDPNETVVQGKVSKIYRSSDSFSAGVLTVGLHRRVRFAGAILVGMDENVIFHGEWKENSRYGAQFIVDDVARVKRQKAPKPVVSSDQLALENGPTAEATTMRTWTPAEDKKLMDLYLAKSGKVCGDALYMMLALMMDGFGDLHIDAAAVAERVKAMGLGLDSPVDETPVEVPAVLPVKNEVMTHKRFVDVRDRIVADRPDALLSVLPLVAELQLMDAWGTHLLLGIPRGSKYGILATQFVSKTADLEKSIRLVTGIAYHIEENPREVSTPVVEKPAVDVVPVILRPGKMLRSSVLYETLEFISTMGRAKMVDIVGRFGISRSAAATRVKNLMALGAIVRVGMDVCGCISSAVYGVQGTPPLDIAPVVMETTDASTKRKIRSREEVRILNEEIVAFIRSVGEVTCRSATKKFGGTTDAMRFHLKNLVAQRVIVALRREAGEGSFGNPITVYSVPVSSASQDEKPVEPATHMVEPVLLVDVTVPPAPDPAPVPVLAPTANPSLQRDAITNKIEDAHATTRQVIIADSETRWTLVVDECQRMGAEVKSFIASQTKLAERLDERMINMHGQLGNLAKERVGVKAALETMDANMGKQLVALDVLVGHAVAGAEARINERIAGLETMMRDAISQIMSRMDGQVEVLVDTVRSDAVTALANRTWLTLDEAAMYAGVSTATMRRRLVSLPADAVRYARYGEDPRVGRKGAVMVRSDVFGIPVDRSSVDSATSSVSVFEVLHRLTPIKMIAGKYTGWTGYVQSICGYGKGSAYELALTSTDGKRGRTSVGIGTKGKTWEVVEPSVDGVLEVEKELVS